MGVERNKNFEGQLPVDWLRAPIHLKFLLDVLGTGSYRNYRDVNESEPFNFGDDPINLTVQQHIDLLEKITAAVDNHESPGELPDFLKPSKEAYLAATKKVIFENMPADQAEMAWKKTQYFLETLARVNALTMPQIQSSKLFEWSCLYWAINLFSGQEMDQILDSADSWLVEEGPRLEASPLGELRGGQAQVQLNQMAKRLDESIGVAMHKIEPVLELFSTSTKMSPESALIHMGIFQIVTALQAQSVIRNSVAGDQKIPIATTTFLIAQALTEAAIEGYIPHVRARTLLKTPTLLINAETPPFLLNPNELVYRDYLTSSITLAQDLLLQTQANAVFSQVFRSIQNMSGIGQYGVLRSILNQTQLLDPMVMPVYEWYVQKVRDLMSQMDQEGRVDYYDIVLSEINVKSFLSIAESAIVNSPELEHLLVEAFGLACQNGLTAPPFDRDQALSRSSDVWYLLRALDDLFVLGEHLSEEDLGGELAGNIAKLREDFSRNAEQVSDMARMRIYIPELDWPEVSGLLRQVNANVLFAGTDKDHREIGFMIPIRVLDKILAGESVEGYEEFTQKIVSSRNDRNPSR